MTEHKIYKKLQEDYVKFKNSDRYNKQFINGEYNDDWKDKDYWISEYLMNLSDENKNEIFNTFGIFEISKSLDDIANFFSYPSYKDMLDECNDKEFMESNILLYISVNTILEGIY